MAIDTGSYYYRSTTDIVISNMSLLEKLNMIYNIMPSSLLTTSEQVYVLSGLGSDYTKFRAGETEIETVNTYLFIGDKFGIELETSNACASFRTSSTKVILKLFQHGFSFNEYYMVDYIENKEDHFNASMMNPDISDWEIYEMVLKIKSALPK